MLKPSLEDLFKSSIRSVLKNKSRTLLTTLGVIIGVTSVILLTSIGNGLKIYVNEQFEALGSNTIFVSPGKIFSDSGGFSRGAGSGGSTITTSFSLKDVNNLKRNLNTNLVMPMKTAPAQVKSRDIKKSVTVLGTNYLYGPNNNSVPSEGNGRWFTREEEDKKSNVAILGNTIAIELFPSGNALGKKIVVGSKNLKIIGINDIRGSSFGGPSVDEYIYVPFAIASDIAGDENIQQIIIKAADKN
ncbi:MAG: ABC transporter permease, partial [Candidatus Shapirobacteria bacterium]|nr:ABC transporter permease [Candidatus Shapirobacteria bacterium]